MWKRMIFDLQRKSAGKTILKHADGICFGEGRGIDFLHEIHNMSKSVLIFNVIFRHILNSVWRKFLKFDMLLHITYTFPL